MTARRLILHICCGPDATVPWHDLCAEGWDVVGCFDGSNIHPADERARRLDAVRTVSKSVARASSGQGRLLVLPYDPTSWHDAAAGYESCPEGGERCAICFEHQFVRTARAARSVGADVMCTTLTISPHKDVELIQSIGERTAAMHGLGWLSRVWRKRDGFKRSVVMSAELGLYRQRWCGCVWSRREDAELGH